MTLLPADSRPPLALFEAAGAEEQARALLPVEIYDFIAGGSGREQALRANQTAFDTVTLTPRVLAGASEPETAATLLRSPVAAPLAVAPMAYQCLVHPHGEAALARAAARAGIVYIAAMLSSIPLSEITAQGARTWLQLYWLRDRRVTENLIGQAEDEGVEALVVTVDVPRMGRRLRDMRNAFRLPADVTAANLPQVRTAHEGRRGSSALMVHTAEAFDPSLSWDDIAWITTRTSLPVVVKGIMHPDDAQQAAEAGAAAVIVSNHGGRQFDSAASPLTALPTITARQPDVPLYFDSGIRSGSDVLKAIALGADAALIGRPVLWGLAIGGEEGASLVLDLIVSELRDAMALAGAPDLAAARTLTAEGALRKERA